MMRSRTRSGCRAVSARTPRGGHAGSHALWPRCWLILVPQLDGVLLESVVPWTVAGPVTSDAFAVLRSGMLSCGCVLPGICTGALGCGGTARSVCTLSSLGAACETSDVCRRRGRAGATAGSSPITETSPELCEWGVETGDGSAGTSDNERSSSCSLAWRAPGRRTKPNVLFSGLLGIGSGDVE